jgi:hypothetical protein
MSETNETTIEQLSRVHDGPAAGLSRVALLRRLSSLYTDLGDLDRAIEGKHNAINATIAALDKCPEGPATDRELRAALTHRYGKPSPM